MLRGRHLSLRSMAKDRCVAEQTHDAKKAKLEIRSGVGIRSGEHSAVQDDVVASHERGFVGAEP